jgi:[ribosomal protein S5]-alanine N-acetyltransferase
MRQPVLGAGNSRAFHPVPSSFHHGNNGSSRYPATHSPTWVWRWPAEGYHGRVPITTRLVARDDVPALVDLMRANREFLAPWEPLRTDEFFTCEYQDTAIASSLEQYELGTMVPHVILHDGVIVGRITLNNIVRGPLQSAKLGSWVASAANGRGVATAAVAAIVPVAFDELRLHRIAAATLLHNVRSQRVLERNGFVRIGVAPRYLQIAGEYQDHALYQRLADDAG